MGRSSGFGVLLAVIGALAIVGFVVRPKEGEGPEIFRPTLPKSEPKPKPAPVVAEPEVAPAMPAPPSEPVIVEAPAPEPVQEPDDDGSAWTGVVRGLPHGGLLDSIRRFSAVESDGDERHEVSFDADGRFSTRLPDGSYRAVLATLSSEIELGTVDVSGPIEHDLVIPGTALVGEIRWVGGTPDEREPIEVAIHREGVELVRGADLRAGTHFVFLGLKQGRYFLTTSPRTPLGGTAQGVRVDVDGTRDKVVIDLLVAAE
jgi:hypothetical protein